ncbi:MAG: 3-deoxy-7-phosphoheptulonate synthase [Verrucomicrobiota bacterium]
MIVALRPNTPQPEIDKVIEEVKKLGYTPHPIYGDIQTVIAATGDECTHTTLEALDNWYWVESVLRVQKRYKLTSRDSRTNDQPDTVIHINGIKIGHTQSLTLMAGPCSVENEEQILTTARSVKKSGAKILRGGAFKPRTSPYEFQGLGEEGLKLLAQARDETGLSIVTELLAEQDVELVANYADILQIGARNAQNFRLLTAAAKTGKPILLKRGMSMKIEEWLLAAEYILSSGNPNVMLCERGIRTFETYTRNTLDLSAVAIAKQESHLPVIVDPSQGCGRASLITELCKAAVSINCDGLIIEVHPNPAEALSDGQQQVDLKGFDHLVKELQPFLQVLSR